MTHQEIRDLIYDVVVLGARRIFERDGVVRAWTFVLATCHPATGESLPKPTLAAVPMNHLMDDKNRARQVQQKICEDTRAIALAFVTEAWLTEFDADKVYEDIDEARKRRREIVHISLETREGSVCWCIPIVRDVEGCGTLGETEETIEPLSGHFTHYFQTQKPEIEA